MTRKIVKTKLNNTGTADVFYEEVIGDDSVTEKISKECGNEVHEDLVNAFKALDIHLAVLCDQGEYTAFEEEPTKLDIFRVTQITIGGSDEHVGVTLTGTRKLKNDKVLNLNSPFTKLSQANSDYVFCAALDHALNEALSEVDLYLNGKYAPKRQLNLFDPSNAPEGEEVEKKPKKEKKAKHVKLEIGGVDVEVADSMSALM